ncbi:peroxidase-like [Bicyclus anynana]|uniref:Peroxidase-like n=1 Tax=Bicyclus anynana TaxID=110368 RepID=A0A6J1MVF4_BICAN|nr:peroxidase-like [Bicyclus anynana]
MAVHCKYKLLFTLLFTAAYGDHTLVYDSYSGRVLSPGEYVEHIISNTTFWCTNEIEPCNPHEGRRVDGSCNNLQHPSVGASHTPGYHVLPVVFDGYNDSRRSCSGYELPLSRRVRTTLLLEGRLPDPQYSMLLTHFWVFMAGDILSIHDTINYVLWNTHCCGEYGWLDPDCVPIRVPDDDPVLRFSNQRCLNLTKPFTFQSTGCTGTYNPPERTVTATSVFDLSQVYGDNLEVLLTKKRLFEGGLLKYEVVEGRIWPPTLPNYAEVCLLNQPPRETRCHDVGEDSSNSILGINLFVIWMWRHHNLVAAELAAINPCWDDEKLFTVSRDINVALIMQIYYYELYPLLLGEENMIDEGLLSTSVGYRDVYDENVLPQVSLEYGFSLRWGHTIQEGIVKMYDTHGNYVKNTRIANLTLRTGYLAVDDNIDYITQGAFRQPTGNVDHAVDPDIAETGLGAMQTVADLTSDDLQKNRYLGIAPYVYYRKYCFGDNIETFDDLLQAIDVEKVELLKELYYDVKDIDLMAGMWVERPISRGRVPATLYCLNVDQLRRSIVSDRHWYERQHRPNAFTIDQLLEIRRASIARILCNVGDTVTEIQKRAFIIPGVGNEIVSCEEIPKIDLQAWADARCHSK